jgi:hypothetical protein
MNKSGFPIWFIIHGRRGLSSAIMVIFALLHRFATHFFSQPSGFIRHRRWFAAMIDTQAMWPDTALEPMPNR